MNVLLNVKNKKMTCASVLSVMLLAVLLSGCEPPGGAPGASGGRPGGKASRPTSQPSTKKASPKTAAPGTKTAGPIAAIPGASKTPVIAVPPGKNAPASPPGDKPLLGLPDKIEQAGNTVELASAILTAGTNPFMDRLPKPLIAEVGSGDVSPAQPLGDPFEGINLMGIVYHPQNPLALISTETDGKSQLIRKDTDVALPGGLAHVTNITRDGVEFQLQGGSKEKRTFNLPNIIEFAATGKESGSSPVSTGTNNLTGGNELSNLKKLSGSNDPADVVLKEP